MARQPELHLAVALDGAGWHPASWREDAARPDELFDAGYWRDVVREAEHGLLDFATLADAPALQSSRPDGPDERTDQVRGRLDAALIASRIAPETSRIGLVPASVVAHTEPFHVSKSIATLDYVSTGRAGWQPTVSASAAQARHFGRRDLPRSPTDAQLAELHDEAAEHVAVVRGLWDSWEDDAEIRDVATGRFLDRDKLHYVDFRGKWFDIKGPSITPRPPQGQPLVTASAHDGAGYLLAARAADVVFVTPHDIGQTHTVLRRVRTAESDVGRDQQFLHVFGDLVVFLGADAIAAKQRKDRLDELDGAEYTSDAAVFTGTPGELADLLLLLAWADAGLSGFRLRPGAIPHDLVSVTRELVPELHRRGAFRREYESATLRGSLDRAPKQPLRRGRSSVSKPLKQIHLAAHFPGVNNTTVWSDPAAGSQIEFDSFAHLARTAERAKFDFLFLAEGLRLREHAGRIHDLDVAGRPDTFSVLSALAAVTERLGLAATINSTFNEPYDVARQFATLDHLSAGRAAWNVVTSWDTFTGENFRRGAFLREDQRYERAELFLLAARQLFDSWRGDAREKNLSTRELVIEVGGRQAFIGSPSTVAAEINRFVQEDASDGLPKRACSPARTRGGC